MKSLTFLSFFIAFILIGHAQDDRGCGIYSSFFTYYEHNETDENTGIYGEGSGGIGDLESKLRDSCFTLLKENEVIIIGFSYMDELMWGHIPSGVEWYKDGVLMSASDYTYSNETRPGACDQTHHLNTNLVVDEPGTYQLIVKGFRDHIMTAVVIGEIEEEELVVIEKPKSEFLIYPNPSTDHFFLQQGETKVDLVQLIDLNGKLIKTVNVSTDLVVSDISTIGINKGTYVVLALSNNNVVHTSRLILR